MNKNMKPEMTTEKLAPNVSSETSWEEVKDVFKSTAGNKPYMQGKAFTKSELVTFINEPLKQAANNQIISLSDVKKNIEQLKANHTHGS